MSGLLITVTSAGHRALVNRTNTGTNAVTVTHIGLSAATFTATEDLTALPGEFLRLTSFGGVAVAKDTLHLSIRDDGPSQYAYRAFGLYLGDGKQHIDHQTRIEHVEPNCYSREHYKGILDGSSHGVFNGKVYVQRLGLEIAC